MAGSGRVIVRLVKKIDEGQILCDKDSTRVAKVMELIGPVDGPYASAAPLTNSIGKFAGKRVFAEPAPAVRKNIRRRRR